MESFVSRSRWRVPGHMAKKSMTTASNDTIDVRERGTCGYCSVGDEVVPADAEDSTLAAHVKCL